MPTHRILSTLAVLLCIAQPLAGQCLPAPAPARATATAASDVPSPDSVLGHALGERFTDVASVERYFRALAESSPLVRVREYGRSAEGRPLLQAVIASPGHLSRLDEVLAANRRLTDPSTTEAEARRIIADNPLVAYLSYGVHGNESASTEAAVWTAWDLARGAPEVAGVLDSVVVVIDPVANPDGRERYVSWYRQASGLVPNPNPESREHWEPWPGGRYNHYLFDLNRDWSWVTQPETQARLATWDTWWPQVVVDFHEMGYQSSYFFFPATEPINPVYPDHILEWGAYFGGANARAFDRCGWAYYTDEAFDLFYPGYGDSWPSLTGAIGMTYEQAGSGRGGLAIERPDGSLLTLTDRAQHHRVAGHATLRAAAAARSRLLSDFARFHRTVDQGLPDFLIPPDAVGRADELVAMLTRQGIRVQRAGQPFRVDARPHPGFEQRRSFPAGTFRVPARQPRGRLAATLLQPETVLDATYSYDVSAWSLPYAFGVATHAARDVPRADWTEHRPVQGDPAGTPAAAGAVPTQGGAQPYGYLVRPSLEGWRGVIRLLAADGRALALRRGFELDGEWPAGTIFVPRAGNADLTAAVRDAGLAATAVPIETGLTTRGRDLGTDEAIPLSLPRVGVLTGEDVQPTSYGAHWFFLERTLGLPFDALRSDVLGAIELAEYDVIVLPEGGVGDSSRLAALRDWVQGGGTLVAVGGAAAAVAEEVGGVDARERPESEEEGDALLARALRGREERQLDRWEQQIPGTVLPVTLDPDHPLAFGAGAAGDSTRLFVLHTGGSVFEPATSFESVAHFPAELRAVSGVISDENLELLSRGTWLATSRRGSGRVVLFADDPLFRHFWYGAFPLYINALMLMPND